MQVSAIKTNSSYSGIKENKSTKNCISIHRSPKDLDEYTTLSFKGKQGFLDNLASGWKKFWKELEEEKNRPKSSDDDSSSGTHYETPDEMWDDFKRWP